MSTDWVVGVDEVGVGALAGPMVAVAAALPRGERPVPGVRDSKKLSPTRREDLARLLRPLVVHAYGEVSEAEIEQLGHFRAVAEVLRRAVLALPADRRYSEVLVDGPRPIPGLRYHQVPIIHGDAREYSIGAASILAKVYRDGLLGEASERYPEYGWAQNAGYGTGGHLSAIEQWGVTEYHRLWTRPVRHRLGARAQAGLPLLHPSLRDLESSCHGWGVLVGRPSTGGMP